MASTTHNQPNFMDTGSLSTCFIDLNDASLFCFQCTESPFQTQRTSSLCKLRRARHSGTSQAILRTAAAITWMDDRRPQWPRKPMVRLGLPGFKIGCGGKNGKGNIFGQKLSKTASVRLLPTWKDRNELPTDVESWSQSPSCVHNTQPHGKAWDASSLDHVWFQVVLWSGGDILTQVCWCKKCSTWGQKSWLDVLTCLESFSRRRACKEQTSPADTLQPSELQQNLDVNLNAAPESWLASGPNAYGPFKLWSAGFLCSHLWVGGNHASFTYWWSPVVNLKP